MTDLAYRRVLLKLSGEALMGSEDYGIDPKVSSRLAREVIEAQQAGAHGEVLGRLGEEVVERRVDGAEAEGHSELRMTGRRTLHMLGARSAGRATVEPP